jgi:hypothetical protein
MEKNTNVRLNLCHVKFFQWGPTEIFNLEMFVMGHEINLKQQHNETEASLGE